jgi:transcription initiation factor TFIIB
MNVDRENELNCPVCGGTKTVSDKNTGENVCLECGYVLDDMVIDHGPEYRMFSTSESADRRRTGVGYSYTIFDKGLSTIIKGNRDARGNKLDFETQRRMERLRRQDNRSKINEAHSRNLTIAMSELDRMASELHLPHNIKEEAALIYRRCLKEDLIRGRSIDAFVAASIYAACRLKKVPRPLKRVAKVSKRELREVSMTYRIMLRELNLKPPIDGPFKFIPSIASKLKVKQETERLAVEILRRGDKARALMGKDPRGLAAAALYMACQENNDRRVQRVIAEAAGTTEVTLRNRYKGLKKAVEDLPTPESVQPIPVFN